MGIVAATALGRVFSLDGAYVYLINDAFKAKNLIIGVQTLFHALGKQNQLIFIAGFVSLHAT